MNQNEQQNGGELSPEAKDRAWNIAQSDELHKTLCDALSGWRYIRETHGDLYGVGWDRVERRLDAQIVASAKRIKAAALSSSASEPVGEPVQLTEEDRSDLYCGSYVFRVPPYDKNPQSQRIADLMVRLSASPLPQEPREAELTDERIFEIADSDEANPDNTGWGPKFNILPFARAIERELRGAQEVKAGEWLPIESAPKDGSHVQLFRPEIQFVGYYAVNAGCWCINAPRLPVMEPAPTHWKPLDAPPSPTLNESADSRGEKE